MNDPALIVAVVYGIGMLVTGVIFGHGKLPLSTKGIIGIAILASAWPWLLVVVTCHFARECVDEVLP